MFQVLVIQIRLLKTILFNFLDKGLAVLEYNVIVGPLSFYLAIYIRIGDNYG